MIDFTTFITNQTDLDKVITNNSTQNYVNMSTYLINAIEYCKLNNVRCLYFPNGTYVFNQTNITALNDVELIAYGAIIRDNNLSGTNSIWSFTNCRNIKISGFYFLGKFGSYSDFDFIKVGTDCSYFKLFNNRFQSARRSFIFVENLRGSASREGCTIINNLFINQGNYNNNQQSAIILGSGGEYNIILNNTFKSCPSAIRCINGANTIISENIILSMASQEFDPNYERALIYCDNSGSNRGKIDIIGNKINHNAIGTTAIVMRGGNLTNSASKIVNNDILVHGNTTNSNAIYLLNAPKTMVLNNKISGNKSSIDVAININNCNGTMLNYNHIIQYDKGISLTNSYDVKQGWNSFDSVVNEYETINSNFI
jgi:hypothetical protein